ncbi:DeoR family transcriptional regulator [Escherichia coli]|nr:DeoR family transcriptional regulator [Escherichia coli]EJH2739733.1 DeoR family transcriptional regulator [Escherichia coli]
MQRPDEEARYDRLAVRLSVIISRLMAGETLTLQTLSGEFGVSIRTLRRDLHQRLVHLDIIGENGTYRLEDIISASLSEQTFRRRSEISSLITEEGFISALPHFRFISDVIHTFREQHPEHPSRPKGVKS